MEPTQEPLPVEQAPAWKPVETAPAEMPPPMFDPKTGQPLAPQPRFDPNTGQPLQPKFDPNTGQPIGAPAPVYTAPVVAMQPQPGMQMMGGAVVPGYAPPQRPEPPT